MAAILLVTNDFPPRIGGIQSYLRDYLKQLDPAEVIVFASTQDTAAAATYDANLPYKVVRYPQKVMLPTPAVRRKMQALIKEHQIKTVWFGAAAPLAVLGKAAKKAGAKKVVATTHGHEVGWSMLPGARQALRYIGHSADTITYISEYTLRRFRSAFGKDLHYQWMPSGVDIDFYRPASVAEIAQTRQKFQIPAQAQVITCVSRLVPRKGQDQLIKAIREIPSAQLLIVGQGRYLKRLQKLAQPVGDRVRFLGRLSHTDMRDIIAASDIFAMPARTRGAGLDVEGLGIVYLEAQACGIPVLAGNSGGAPETVTASTGVVVNGRRTGEIVRELNILLANSQLRAEMGNAGRQEILAHWTWQEMGKIIRRTLL
ncbi:glycosyltransferase family 4 protein [Corynebacterium caspium]|uniref:glycosyltransferase family 4 protein n=1 Tax=Corynebacterium caspium TaxID=234828 RepID=UPI00035C1598|nr:glycosyltransferase family 4 protein [Corynebacterium caspium]WKD58974.1 GDP-mannose-dependent alpha-(1-6)-phosphatidylinositol monomannoside mannosyltransferase [Corynebacterium caspium DSM 44850]